ncbi:hypothetical protein Glove_109g113 [Diversispora epigaea]|uniref:Uncharacterized protein n=1 Tax=Diversispora epigaea TaxID=1348612 RepID=A0A397J8H7_9GLOM|nr:hypothetical protein Glove_109g113 [Diversispora epigaea]
MSQIHTLSDIDKGNKLGNFLSNRYPSSRTELENYLSQANQDYKTAIDYGNQIADYNKLLLDKCTIQVKSFNQEKKTWDLEKKDLNRKLTQYYNEIDKLQKENTNLISQITEKELSLSKLKSKLKKNSEKKDEEICSLNFKLSELEHMKNELIEKNDKLEHQKSDILTDSNRTIFLRQFLRKNNKQNPDSLDHIKLSEQQDFTFQNDVSQRDIPYISGGIAELVPVAKSRVFDSGHIESMSYKQESASFPNMASSSPLQTYIILGLILIVFIWFIIKRIWTIIKKSEKKTKFPISNTYFRNSDMTFMSLAQ